MRRRRVLKLLLVPSLAFLFFLAFLALPQQQNLNIDAALDKVLKGYLDHLPPTSAQYICPDHDSQSEDDFSRSPRDFQVSKHTSHVAKTCESLRTKKILLVGPQTTFYLHSLWLSALETHDRRTHDCPGLEFCNFHHICLPPAYSTPNDRYKFPPKDEELIASGSAVMRYVLSTSLYVARDKNDPGYTQPVVDPATGIRLKNTYWLLQARKTDIVLMNRGPIPAPAWTYAGHRRLGNWTFARDLPRHLEQGDSLAIEVINAAFHATVTRFIPEVLESLRTIQEDPLIRHKTLAWHASWFFDAVAFHSPRTVDDPWALYYNAQVYMQNYLLRALLPRYGVHFLSRVYPSRVEAEGPLTDPAPHDKLRFRLGTPNAQAMEAVFLESLIELLECVT
ncbi:hypothetical protein C8R47DRAFT_973606 [Mycena vitilis]|nr:hypothetical protein C8R47DRAFT_973606 [Mycena vitilis]